MPTAVFSTPEVGTVGLPEDAARERYPKLDIYKAQLPAAQEHAVGPRRAHVHEADRRRRQRHASSAATCWAHDAAEIVQMAAIAMRLGATKADFDATMALHPSAAEELVTMREKWVPPVSCRRAQAQAEDEARLRWDVLRAASPW